MKTYTINPGYAFMGDDGRVKQAGDTLELADDLAALHGLKVTLFNPQPAETPQEAPFPAAEAPES